jgi:hypothetical protein
MKQMTAKQMMILTTIGAAIVGFGIGALWQYTSARSYAGRLAVAESQYTFQRLEATLGAATIEAQRGSFETARQLASDFFTGLQTSIERAPTGVQPTFRDILHHRDDMITALSRSDPQADSMLAGLFFRYRIAMGEPVGPEAEAVGTPAAAPPADSMP